MNNLRFQWGRDLEVAGSNAPGPYVSLSNIANYGEFYALPRTAELDEHRTQIADTLSLQRGKHTFKAGFDLNIIHEVMINLFQGTGRYTYSGTAQQAFNNWVLDVCNVNTGDGLTGRHFNSFVQVNDPITHVGKDDFYEQDFAGFVEDTWHPARNVTLNAGLRYDLFLIPAPPPAQYGDASHQSLHVQDQRAQKDNLRRAWASPGNSLPKWWSAPAAAS